MNISVRALTLLVCSVAILVASSVRARAATPEKPAYNILLITPDQMRAASMHTFGYAYADTPNIDKLASEGTVFTRAYSVGAWTTPSFASILTGLFPTVHGMTLPPYQACGSAVNIPLESGEVPPDALLLSPFKPIIADILKKQGMSTAADVANCWAIWDMHTRSWDTWKEITQKKRPPSDNWFLSSLYLTAPQTVDWAKSWLSEHRSQRFFFWVHFMEPHAPYNAPEEYDRFKTPDDYPNLSDGQELHALARVGDVHAIRRLKQLYAAKILYADHYIGELLASVHQLGLDKNTIVILVSDHGQLLYSHPEDFNIDEHRSLYDTNLHVPLIVRGPGIPAGKRKDAIVAQYDIVPTILDLESLPIPSWVDGKSLKSVLMGDKLQVHKYVYAEETLLTPQYSIRDQRYKVIESLRTGKIQCFDDLHDAAESQSICGQIPAIASELKAALDRHIQAAIQQAKSYPDWKHNLALSVIDQRDSGVLKMITPKTLIASPVAPYGAHCQLTGRLWSRVENQKEIAFWAPAGDGSTLAIWRSDTPLIGDYDISVRYEGTGQPSQTLARHASFRVNFKGGTLSFPIDENETQGTWVSLGRFHDPVSVVLTNLADGPVVAESVRFVQVTGIHPD